MGCANTYLPLVKWLLMGILSLNVVNGLSNSSQPLAAAIKLPTSCASSLSCRSRCSADAKWDKATGQTGPHCHCDKLCSKYKDCCGDYQQFCGNQSALDADSVFVCRKMNDYEPSIWLAESCPSSYPDSDTRDKCLSNQTLRADSIIDQMPVADLVYHIQYKNQHCAKCNNANPLVIFFFEMRFKCNLRPPDDLNATQVIGYMLKYCNTINMGLEKGEMRRFCYPTESACPSNSAPDLRDGCERGDTAVVYHAPTETNYRNPYCMACNGLDASRATCGPQKTGKDNFFDPKSFEVVLNFKKPPGEDVEIKREKVLVKCPVSDVYDPHLEICRLGHVVPAKGISDKYRVKMWLSPLDGGRPQNFSHSEFVREISSRFGDLLAEQIEVSSVLVEDKTTTVLFDLHALYSAEKNAGKNASSGALRITAILNFNKSFEIEAAQRKWRVFKVTTRILSCSITEKFLPGQYKLLKHGNVVVNSSGKIETFSPKQYYMDIKNESQLVTNSPIIVCRSFFGVRCNKVMLPVLQQEYVIFSNKTLLFKPTGQRYYEGEYDVKNSTPWICTNYTRSFLTNTTKNTTTVVPKKKHEDDIHTEIRRYMTIVGLSISVLCLFLVLLTHGILHDLRAPLPGKNLMSLSLSLFLAHFWYLFASGKTNMPLFCQFTAYILHYLFLASFGCTFVVAYDTRRTFSVKTAKAHAIGSAHQAKRLVMYVLVSWGVPLVVVATCALLDAFSLVTIGYRNKDACWMENATALLVVFAAPVGAVLVYNVVAFTQTVYAINSARKQTKRVNSTHYARPATVKIYIRLISLMGFSWFFGISAPLIHQGLMYPFVFFTTLQGLYIFLAFVCKARVLRMIKAKLPLKKGQPVRSPTKVTTTTTDSRTSTPYTKYPLHSKDETQI